MFSKVENEKFVIAWLVCSAIMIFLMVVIGGLTRLTESGLSIVEWQPIKGTLPPLNIEDWNKLFDQYKTSPQYQKVNAGMSLEQFKNIFWLEFIHRLAGRITGLVFLLPLVYFAFTKKIKKELISRLILIFLIGGFQGFIGWYMVKSGLANDPQVSQYRLALHLAIAFIIYGLIIWTIFDLLKIKKPLANKQIRNFSLFLTAIIFLQIISGAFVAGLDAGLIYNTFPLMDGKIIPDGMFIMEPKIKNYFENVTTVQFTHRLHALVVLLSTVSFWYVIKNNYHQNGYLKTSVNLLVISLVIQLILGIFTLIYQVPIGLASLHQVNSLILFSVSLFINHLLYDIKP